MALGTFGTIMRFASNVVEQSASFYEAAGRTVKDAELKAALESLAEDGRRNCALMEQTRRQNVTEMILEPIRGLDEEDYMDVKVSGQAKDAEVLKMALLLEEREQRFFRDASSAMPLPEVARIFRKMAQKKEKNLAKLRSLGAYPKTLT